MSPDPSVFQDVKNIPFNRGVRATLQNSQGLTNSDSIAGMAGWLPDIEVLAPDDLKGLVLQILRMVYAVLTAKNAALREDRRLKVVQVAAEDSNAPVLEAATEPVRAEQGGQIAGRARSTGL